MKCFQSRISQEKECSNFDILHQLPELVKEDKNDKFCIVPTLEEIRKVVFSLNGGSACGPDGFSGLFYQHCQEVVRSDVFNIVMEYFKGYKLPESVTHINLLIPKKEVVERFIDLRPISLSNFINKVISKVLHDRLKTLLSKLIYSNRSRFIKRRSIVENVLLT